jgi:hypothetical protein
MVMCGMSLASPLSERSSSGRKLCPTLGSVPMLAASTDVVSLLGGNIVDCLFS